VEPIYLGLGSNRGDRARYLSRALEEISSLPGTELVCVSSVYETEPVGNKDQSLFLNAAARIRSECPPDQLVTELRKLETRLGRTMSERWGPREIDIDVIYYGSSVIAGEGVVVPHPERAKRLFVLVPLAELDPTFVDPEHHCTIRELVDRCPEQQGIVKTAIDLFLPSLEL